MKVGKEVEPVDKRWHLEVVFKYHEAITERQAKAILAGLILLGQGKLRTDEPLPEVRII